MPRSDWAAWVQAVGSILALVIAIWVPNAMERKRMAELKASNARRIVATSTELAIVLQEMIQELYMAHHNLEKGFEAGDPERIHSAMHTAVVTYPESVREALRMGPILPQDYFDRVNAVATQVNRAKLRLDQAKTVFNHPLLINRHLRGDFQNSTLARAKDDILGSLSRSIDEVQRLLKIVDPGVVAFPREGAKTK